MHAAARQFVQEAVAEFGAITGDVVELGGRNANGGVRDLFPQARSYLGIDSTPGPGVDLVQDAGMWQPTQGYACVLSTETLEHAANWRQLIRVGASALAPDGIMIITCASGSRQRHSATIPNALPQPGEYYANVRPEEFLRVATSAGLQVQLTATAHDLHAVCRPTPPPASGLRLIGAGMWRTGTVSLKQAFEWLTATPCYHMSEVLTHPHHVHQWRNAIQGGCMVWPALFHGYGATFDWPSLALWQELSQEYPQALVLLSTRLPEEWWQSASRTVLQSAPTPQNATTPWDHLLLDLFAQYFVGRFPSKSEAIDAYLAHNALVRATVPPARLLEWTPADGWLPLCRALDAPVPAVPFPRANTRAEYRRNHRLDVAKNS